MAVPGQVDFFYFIGSAYAYLSVMRVEKLAAAAGIAVVWRPFSVRTLMIEQKNMIREQKQKMSYTWRDVERRAARHGVPFVSPPVWPTDPDELANRIGIVAAAEGWVRDYTLASFRAWYLDGAHLGDRASLDPLLRDLGQEPDRIVAAAESDAVRAEYAAQTDAARQLGAFGSPTFAVGDEIFWGDDRLEEALDWVAGRHPLQVRSGG